MREYFNRLVTTSVLKRMEINGGHLIDSLLAKSEIADKLPLKNVCAKVSAELADEIDQICDFLDISKRSFIEGAFIDALRQAREIIDAEGLHDYLTEHSRPIEEVE